MYNYGGDAGFLFAGAAQLSIIHYQLYIKRVYYQKYQ